MPCAQHAPTRIVLHLGCCHWRWRSLPPAPRWFTMRHRPLGCGDANLQDRIFRRIHRIFLLSVYSLRSRLCRHGGGPQSVKAPTLCEPYGPRPTPPPQPHPTPRSGRHGVRVPCRRDRVSACRMSRGFLASLLNTFPPTTTFSFYRQALSATLGTPSTTTHSHVRRKTLQNLHSKCSKCSPSAHSHAARQPDMRRPVTSSPSPTRTEKNLEGSSKWTWWAAPEKSTKRHSAGG
jgi:hypothetical protein